MIHYPDTDCEIHCDVRTEEPVCLICLIEDRDRHKELEASHTAALKTYTACSNERERLRAENAELVEALRMLVAFGDQLNDNAIECVFDDSTVEVSSVVYWREFRLALEEADNALAAHRKQGGEQ